MCLKMSKLADKINLYTQKILRGHTPMIKEVDMPLKILNHLQQLQLTENDPPFIAEKYNALHKYSEAQLCSK